MSTDEFAGKTALVTGAAVGIGFASARMFAEHGARVVLADIDETAVSSAAETLAKAGHEALGVAA